MKEKELEILSKQLAKKHYSLKIEWLKSCVEYLEQSVGKNLKSHAEILNLVIHQFLNSPIAESFQPVMKIPNAAAKVYVVRRMIFQVQSYINVSSSLYEQLTDCTRGNDDLKWFHGGKAAHNEETEEVVQERENNTSPKRKRGMLKLELTDGVNTVKAIEIEDVFDEKLLVPGVKILLTGRIKCRRGTLLLNKSSCQVLGGHVASLRIDKVKQLAGLLKIDLDSEKKRRKESLQKAEEIRNYSKQRKAAQKSLNQSSLSPFLMKTDRKTGEKTDPKVTASLKMKASTSIASLPSKLPKLAQKDSFDDEIRELPPPQEPTPEPPESREIDPIDTEFQSQNFNDSKVEKTVTSIERRSPQTLEKLPPPVQNFRKQPMKKVLPQRILQDDEVQHTIQDAPRTQNVPAVSNISKWEAVMKNKPNSEEKNHSHYASIMGFPPCFFPDELEVSNKTDQKSNRRGFEKTLHGPRILKNEDKITGHFQTVKSPKNASVPIEKTRRVHEVQEEKETVDNRESVDIVESILSKIREKSHPMISSKVSDFPESQQQLEEIGGSPDYDDSIMECTMEKEGQLELQRWGLDERLSRKRDAEKRNEGFGSKRHHLGHEDYASLMDRCSHPILEETCSTSTWKTPLPPPPLLPVTKVEPLPVNMTLIKRRAGGDAEQEMKNRQSANVQTYKTPFAKRIPSSGITASAQLHQRMNDLNIVLLGDALSSRKFWMMSKIVVILPTICYQTEELKSDGIDWLWKISVSDTSVNNIFCNVATDLLNRIFGFTVQYCKNLFNAKQIDELRIKKIEAERKLAGFKRLDLVIWMEVSPDPHKIPLIVDVKTLSDALNIL